MDTISITLVPKFRDRIDIVLHKETDSIFYDIPSGKDVVYNDNPYTFSVSDLDGLPSVVHINDEVYYVELLERTSERIDFKIKGHEKPFLHSFGAVRISFEIDDQLFSSNSIAVMVSNSDITDSVMNMVQFIYDNCEKYLYEEHKYSTVITGLKNNDIVSLEAKIAFLQKALKVYKQSYQYFKFNPYCKLQKVASVDSFDKLQVVSQKTIQYISNHIEDLAVVNYDTGIRVNKQFYQPNKVLVEHNMYSYDVYENKIIVGFLKTLVFDITQIIKSLRDMTYIKNSHRIEDGYIDSMYQIFSRSIKKINSLIDTLTKLKIEYQQIYYYYLKVFDINTEKVMVPPKFTSVFRSIKSYRQIFIVIKDWFSIGNYDIGKDELLLSFLSTSKIYEYYCLIKMLYYLKESLKFELVETSNYSYNVRNPVNSETKYNNTFVFKKEDVRLSLYFQPYVFKNASESNNISLFRNTSTSSVKENMSKGTYYTPDFIIKAERDDMSYYLLVDSKFSTPDNFRMYQLQEMVYKYLFSVSPLNDKSHILGMFILCGKTSSSDKEDIIHDYASKLGLKVTPFADILIMNGVNTDDFRMPELLFDCILDLSW